MTSPIHNTYPKTISYKQKSLPYSVKVLLFFSLQVVLAVVIQRFPQFSTFHVFATMIVGLFYLLNDKTPDRLICWMGYVVGAELLWRGTGANTFWETGKYALIAFSFLGLFKFTGNNNFEVSLIPYFLLLVPSIFLLASFNREAISYALAGPLALLITSVFFSRFKIKLKQFKSLLLAILSSVLIFSVLALIGVITAETIDFSQGSLRATSANTGPNQVSSVLALGAFSAIIFVILEKEKKFLRLVVLLLALGLIIQIMLTFSRGGLWTLAGAVLVAGFFFFRDKGSRSTFLLLSTITIILFSTYILPALDRFTSGELSARISDSDTTGRITILLSDLNIFLNHPFFGVGPGQSDYYRLSYYRIAHAHTEFSRMLSEHGVLGATSLLILLIVLVKKIIQKTNRINRAVIASCIVWGLLFMAHSATRLAAPSFLIGLSFFHFNLVDNEKDSKKTRS